MKVLRRLWTEWQAESPQGDESGQNLVLVALLMVVILGIAAMVLDGAYAFAQRRRMQNAADAGAMAGARELALTQDPAQAYTRAVEYAVSHNGADSANVDVDIVGGTVTVTATKTFPTFFAGVLGIDELTATAQSVASYGTVAEMSGGNGVYPIAANCTSGNLEDCFPLGESHDIYAGGGPGNFGWLGWDGCTNVPCLCESLTPPGNSGEYINPYNPSDHGLTIGDWVEGSTGVANAGCVRDQLNDFIENGTSITVVVWDVAEGQGANLNYRIVGFAEFILEDYHLPGQNRITGRFINKVVHATNIQGGADYGLYGVRLTQ